MSKYILIVSVLLNFCFGQVTLSANEINQYYDYITNLENNIEELKNKHQKEIGELKLVIKDFKFKTDDIGGSEKDAKSRVTDTQNKINDFEKAISNLDSDINKKISEKKGLEAKKDLSVGFKNELNSLIVEWNNKFQALVDARVEKNNKEKEIENRLKREPNK